MELSPPTSGLADGEAGAGSAGGCCGPRGHTAVLRRGAPGTAGGWLSIATGNAPASPLGSGLLRCRQLRAQAAADPRGSSWAGSRTRTGRKPRRRAGWKHPKQPESLGQLLRSFRRAAFPPQLLARARCFGLLLGDADSLLFFCSKGIVSWGFFVWEENTKN